MRRATVGLMERHAIAEELARKFYAHLGYGNLDYVDRCGCLHQLQVRTLK